jgi:lipopolysaccharide transport system permease protein
MAGSAPERSLYDGNVQEMRAYLRVVVQSRALTYSLLKREFMARYTGSVAGVAWPFLNAGLMLAIYSIVFQTIFQPRTGVIEQSAPEFALAMFTGLAVYGFFAEPITMAPSYIRANANYVKKVRFPLEILPLVGVLSSAIHLMINLVIVIFALFIFGYELHANVVFIAIALVPIFLTAVGFCMAISAFGVFLRDISSVMNIASTALLFCSPIFYKLESVPENLRALICWSPLTYPVEQIRSLLFTPLGFDWNSWFVNLILGVAALMVGVLFFQRTRSVFSDVL